MPDRSAESPASLVRAALKGLSDHLKGAYTNKAIVFYDGEMYRVQARYFGLTPNMGRTALEFDGTTLRIVLGRDTAVYTLAPVTDL